MGVDVLKVDIRRLREPAALAIVAAVLIGVLVAAGRLLIGSGAGLTFGVRSLGTLGTFASPTNTLLLVVAVLLVTKLGEVTPRAVLVLRGAAAAFGLSLLFGVLALLGVLIGAPEFRDKFENLITGLPMLALTAIGLAFATSSLAELATSRPAAQSTGGFYGSEGGYSSDPYSQGYGQQPAQQAHGAQAGSGAYGQLSAPVDQQQYGQDAYGYAQERPNDAYGAQTPAAPQADAYGARQADAYAQQAYGASAPNAQAAAAQPQAQQPYQTSNPYDQYGAAAYQQDQSGGQGYGQSGQAYGADRQASSSAYGQQSEAAAPSGGYSQPAAPVTGSPMGAAPTQGTQTPAAQPSQPAAAQGSAYDQYGYAVQQPETGGYGQQSYGSEGVGYQQAAPADAQGYTQGSYQEAAQPGHHGAAPSQPQTSTQPGAHPSPSGGSHGLGEARQYDQQYGQQGAFAGYSSQQYADGGAAGGSQSSFDRTDPREQQIAQAYQQAQSYQQLTPATDYSSGPTGPASPYDNPLGHPQRGQDPASYTPASESAEQTARFDPPAYPGDALSGPARREEPLDPTAIYAPERGQAKYEEGSGTDQAGHQGDPNAHWYGSER
ncbi:hypothetical protein Pth03_16850 [Planotetraspora thailandica]|uniref:Uncharacterized protein n=2 Tax=Planotetraspora thailandica TaxID=487172 RepID=A0A8J3V1F6_9ACTN|nr:hypothetical protein Pth03_16850 [Planotetraspora thailandica]